jgi:saccharopine dehydrogenase (NAD+, L-lysine-forming)
MKAVVFGGAGVIGSCSVEYLSNLDKFSEIVIADINEKAAKELSKKNEKISFTKINAKDESTLLQSLNDADVAINCIGPFYKFAPFIIKAAIKKGVNYVDVCDDYDTTELLLDKFNKSAIDANITCIVGLGASPGLTNLIAAYGSKQFTSVEEIKIFVTRSIDEKAGAAIPYHMLHCWLGEIPIYIDGKFKKARGLVDGKEYVKFPKPFGQMPVYYFGHPETVTLPRYIKGVKNVCCKGSFIPTEFRDILVNLDSIGLISENSINIQQNNIKIIDFTAAYIEVLRRKIIEKHKDIISGGSIMVEISGLDDSEEKIMSYSGTAHMQQGTGTPAAIGAKMLTDGDITLKGVYAPEGCIPPEKFIGNFFGAEGFGDVWISFTQKMSGDLI